MPGFYFSSSALIDQPNGFFQLGSDVYIKPGGGWGIPDPQIPNLPLEDPLWEYGTSKNVSYYTGLAYLDRFIPPPNQSLLAPAAPSVPIFGLSLPIQFNPQSYSNTFFDAAAFLPNIIQGPVQSQFGAPFNTQSYRDSYFDFSAFLPNIPTVPNPFFGLSLPTPFNSQSYRDSQFEANAILPVVQAAPNPFVNLWLIQIR